MKIIEETGILLGIFSLLMSLWTLVKPPRGFWGGVLWLPKLWASAWSPFLALAGILGAILGIFTKNYASMLTGLGGATLGIRHIALVIRQHNSFAETFEPNWENQIPIELKERLTKKRYRFIQPAFPAVPGQRNINIGVSGTADNPLLCDIWQPPTSVPHTGLAILYLHGGLWQALDKDFLTQPLFRCLTNQGHVILDLAYSLTPAADLNHMLGDVKKAIVWMKAHASEYAVNPDRIVLMGVSGGAHLALLAAYGPSHPAFQNIHPHMDISVRAVVSIFGITDLSAFFVEYGETNPKQPEYSTQIVDSLRPYIHDKTWMERLLTRSRAFPAYRHANMPGGALLLVYLTGGTLKEIPHVYRQASPINYVGSHCPPTLQIFDQYDFVVDASHGRRLHRALCAAGVKSVYLEFPETVHGFDQYFGVSRRIAPAAQAATYDIERFLALMV